MYTRPFRPKRQRSQYTCMATSLSMCLEAHGIDADEDTTNKVMGAAPIKGARWEEMIAAAQHFGCRATMISPATIADLKRFIDAGSPCVISWNPEGRDWSHASVVYWVSDDLKQVAIADPNMPDPQETTRVLSAHEFYKSWYESWSNYLVRRVCVAVEREITDDGFQRFANLNQSNAYNLHPMNKENPMNTVSIEEFQSLLKAASKKEAKTIVEYLYEELPYTTYHGSRQGPYITVNPSDFGGLRGLKRAIEELIGDTNVSIDDISFDRHSKIKGEIGIGEAGVFPMRFASIGVEKEAAASGLYGFTKQTEKDVAVATAKIQRIANKIAKSTYRKDERIAGFMALHAKRTKSGAANILLTAYQGLGPKIAGKQARLNRKQIAILEKYNKDNVAFAFEDLDGFTQGELGRHCDELKKDVSKWLSDNNFGRALMAAKIHRNAALYGRNPKVVKAGLQAIMDLQSQVGVIANSLHQRRAAKWSKLTNYMKAHLKATKCAYTNCLMNAYPEMPKVASEHTAKYPKGPMSAPQKKKWEEKHPEVAENAKDESKHFADLAEEWGEDEATVAQILAEIEAESAMPGDEESNKYQPNMDDMGYDPGETKRAARTTTLANGDSIEWIED